MIIRHTLDQLAALDAVDRTGSFAAAAAELHKVPSAVSYSIRALESALDVALFDRSGRRAELTAAGRKILVAARDVLDRARALEAVAAHVRGGWEPTLRVVVDGALPMRPILRCIRRFSDPAVPTDLRLEVEYQEGVVDRFTGEDVDIALILGFDGDSGGYDARPLGALDLVLAAAPTLPLADGPATEARRRAHAELVVRDSSPRFHATPKASFLGSRNIVFLSDFHSKREALLDAAGYGWIPRHFVDADLAAGRLVILDASPSTWTYAPQAVRRGDRPLGRAAALFLETLLSGDAG